MRLPTLLLLVLSTAFAGRKRPDPVPEPVPAPAPAAPPAYDQALFPATVVTDPGPTPAGLAGRESAVCAACHPRSYEGWKHGGHARPPPPALGTAAAGLPGCDVCHRPLAHQRATVDTVYDGRLEQVTRTPNPAFDAGAWLEGVGCAACHVRDGAVLTGDAEAAARPAPHPLRFAPALADGRACASCHQLAIPGTDTALYDTWGEFERSGFAEAGVTCLTCHGRAGAEAGFVGHDPGRPLDHGLSVGLSVPSLRLVRGQAPVAATVTVRNVGAGHAIPTGSPWRRLEVRAALVGPPDPKTQVRPRRSEATLALGVGLSAAPPFARSADTRLMPGAAAELPIDLALPLEVVAAGWELVVTVGPPGGPAGVERRWPLAID